MVHMSPENDSPSKTVIKDALRPIKTAIYLVVLLYASYVIVFGTTFLNEWQQTMTYAGILTIAVAIVFVWLGVQLKKHKRF